MLILYNIIIFVFGLIVGSFLNVVIFRLENGGKIVDDRSKCLHCKHILEWYDLIPILSFIFLKGKCRYCKRSISIQYPLIELLTGVLFVLIFNFQFISLLFWLYITAIFIVIFAYDLKHYIIPDKIIYPAIAITSVYKLFEILRFGHWDLIGNRKLEIGNLITAFNPFIAAILASTFFLSIVLFTRGKGMGGGDVKLAFLMGLLLGWPIILLSLFSSFILGSFVGICLILIGKKKMGSMIPFGPFLIIGTFVGLFWGERIVKWYLDIIIY